MKATLEIDEPKLLRLMQLTGIKTRKQAVDYALTEAERIARLNRVMQTPLYVVAEDEPVIDPAYDLQTLREKEKPTW